MTRPGTTALVLLLGLALGLPGRAAAAERPDLTKTRPCGPDSIKGPLRYLFPQRFAGADFRPACVAHDAGYDTLGSDKRAVDDQFRADLFRACDSSLFPRGCRLVGGTMHRLVDRHGDSAYQQGQREAMSVPR